jgi:hypothetical protein
VSCATAGAVMRGVRGTTIGTSEVGTVLDQGSSSSQGEEGRHVARYRGTRALRLQKRDVVEHESTEAGAAKHHANVSQGSDSANCTGSRAPPTVTVMHAPPDRRDGRR